MYTLEQLEVLMLVAESDDPISTALQIRRRWRYILQVALGAMRGQVLDLSMPQVVREYSNYTKKAQSIISALDEWLEEHNQVA
jgi:hypothetical protein